MNSLGQEMELAVLDKGEYQLRPEFRHLVVTGDKWAKMTNDQRKEALSRVHHLVLQETSPNSVASVNKKLVEGESAVFIAHCAQRRSFVKGRKSNRDTGSLSIRHPHHSLKIKAHEAAYHRHVP